MEMLRVLGLAGVLVFACQDSALAQGTADTVILEDGTLLRGTIVEVSPNDYVVIQTATGETRRFQVSDVRYAGPTDRAPSASVAIGESALPTEAIQPYALQSSAVPEGPRRPTLGVPAMVFTLGTGLVVLGGVLIPISYEPSTDDYNDAIGNLGLVIMNSGAMLAITGLIWLIVRGRQRRRWEGGGQRLTIPQYGFAPVFTGPDGHYGLQARMAF